MLKNNSKAFQIYQKVEKSSDLVKSPYEIVRTVLNELHRNIHLIIIELNKKKAFAISKQFRSIKEVQHSISKYVVRSLTTIYGLQTSLDFEKGGKIAINLFQIYEFCRIEIIKAFGKNESVGIKKAYDALTEIIQAWDTMEVKNL